MNRGDIRQQATAVTGGMHSDERNFRVAWRIMQRANGGGLAGFRSQPVATKAVRVATRTP